MKRFLKRKKINYLFSSFAFYYIILLCVYWLEKIDSYHTNVYTICAIGCSVSNSFVTHPHIILLGVKKNLIFERVRNSQKNVHSLWYRNILFSKAFKLHMKFSQMIFNINSKFNSITHLVSSVA